MEGWGRGIPDIYEIIKGNPGIQRKDIISLTKRGSSTIDRHLAVLIERKLGSALRSLNRNVKLLNVK